MVAVKIAHVNVIEAAISADLGGSSKYSKEVFEGRRGEGFRRNCIWRRVSRS